jgi:hypothetical protein
MEARATLIAASCTTGWADWEHGNLWLAPDGIARITLGWTSTVLHSFQGADPALRTRQSISRDELARALTKSPRALWLRAADLISAKMHRGVRNDRLTVQMQSGTAHKLLWVRNKAGTQQLEGALRRWVGPRLGLN